MRLVTASESAEIDCHSLSHFKSDHWMEIAGRMMAEKISKICRRRPLLFLCGPGNNGGDGYVAVKNLVAMGVKKIIVISGSPRSELNQQKFSEISKLGLIIRDSEMIGEADLRKLLEDHAVIDAVFGTGGARSVEDPWKKIFRIVNKNSKLTISLDIPSGLDATTGNILGEALRAHHTLVVAPLKSGLFLNAGVAMAGQIHKIDIGFPEDIVRAQAKSVRLIGQRTWALIKPHRKWSSNKTNFGHVVVVGGSPGFEGAAILAAEAALRGGAGYVSIFSDSPKMNQRCPPDFLLHELSKFDEVMKQKKVSSIIFGPGLKISFEAQEIFEKLWTSGVPVVLDAGGFHFLAEDEKQRKALPDWVLTPHAGELSRLIGIPAGDLEKNRLVSAAQAAKSLGGIVVFKGFRPVVHSAGVNYIIHSGNPSLAKSGTGDVLSGLLGAYLAQRLSADKATVLATWVHGHLADRRLQQGKSMDSLMASDLIRALEQLRL